MTPVYYRSHFLDGTVANYIRHGHIDPGNADSFPACWGGVLWGNTNPTYNCAIYHGVDIELASWLVHTNARIKVDCPLHITQQIEALYDSNRVAFMDFYDIAVRIRNAKNGW